MNTTNNLANKEPFTPWYKEPWVWAILGILVFTFVWGSYRIYFAFQVQDSVVVDDYYKNGKAINEDLTRDKNAKALGISAQLLIDDLTGEVRITLTGDAESWPEQLRLSLLSPVFAEKDRTLLVNKSYSANPAEPVYVGQVDQLVEGKTYVQLETLDKSIPEVGYQSGWRLNQTLIIKTGETIGLKPRQ